MRDIEGGVSKHYASYDVLTRIRAGLVEMGHNPDRIAPDILKPVDEFHMGGAEATVALLEKLAISPDMDVLDIGSGIGGPARMIAARYGCRVTGIDLTPHFVETARTLSAMCGMAESVRFEIGSAVALPLDDASFDLALLHVGMNIPDKAALFREAHRVLRDGGTFAVYEVMRTGDGDLNFPVPWVETPDLSALETPEAYRAAAKAAGFALETEENRREVALDFFARLQARAASGAPPPLAVAQSDGANCQGEGGPHDRSGTGGHNRAGSNDLFNCAPLTCPGFGSNSGFRSQATERATLRSVADREHPFHAIARVRNGSKSNEQPMK